MGRAGRVTTAKEAGAWRENDQPNVTQRPVRNPVPACSLMLRHQDWPGLDFPSSYKKLILNTPPWGAGNKECAGFSDLKAAHSPIWPQEEVFSSWGRPRRHSPPPQQRCSAWTGWKGNRRNSGCGSRDWGLQLSSCPGSQGYTEVQLPCAPVSLVDIRGSQSKSTCRSRCSSRWPGGLPGHHPPLDPQVHLPTLHPTTPLGPCSHVQATSWVLLPSSLSPPLLSPSVLRSESEHKYKGTVNEFAQMNPYIIPKILLKHTDGIFCTPSFLGVEKEMTTHSSILAWEIPWTGSLVGHSPWDHKSRTQLSD